MFACPLPLRALAIAALACTLHAHAQSTAPALTGSAAPASTTAAVRSYDLPAQPLGSALARIAADSGQQISIDADLVRGRTAPAVRGDYTGAQAAAAALAGSGLQLVQTGTGNWALRRAPIAPQAQGDTLATVVVKATPETATGPVVGYVAQRSATATKSDQAITETARSISVVTAELMEERKAGTVEEAVGYTAGVRAGGYGLDFRFDQIDVRGYSALMQGDFLDGLRQPYSGMLSMYASEPFMLERIEVLKGPSSVLYGQIAPGGMINRVSKRPDANAQQEIQLQVGSNSHKQAQLDIGGQIDEHGDLRWRLVGVARDANTDIAQVNNDVRAIAPSLLWRISPDTQLTLLAQYSDKQTAGSAWPWQNGTELTDFWPGDENFDKLDQQQWTLGYELEHRFNDRFKLAHNLRYGKVDTTNQYLYVTGAAGTVLNRGAYGIYETMDSLLSDTRLVARAQTGAARHELSLGLDWSQVDADMVWALGSAPSIDMAAPNYHQSIATPSLVATDSATHTTRRGLYLQDLVELGPWRLSGALRHDTVSAHTDNRLLGSGSGTRSSKTTGQAGVLYVLESGLAPYASFGQSFLPTSGTDIYGRPYAPTAGEQVEAGLKYKPPGSNSLYTVSLYQLTQSNVRTRDPLNALNYVQTGEERSRGLELEMASELSRTLKMTASYSYNRAQVTRSNDGNEGKAPVNKPRHLASAWLHWRTPVQGMSLGGGVRFTGASFNDSANTLRNASYTLLDLALGYDIPGTQNRARVELNAKNLSDRRYVVCEAGYCYRGEGRAVVASLRYRW